MSQPPLELGENQGPRSPGARNAYRILLVASARDSGARRIADLPNPSSGKEPGPCNPLGRGLRYQCSFIAS